MILSVDEEEYIYEHYGLEPEDLPAYEVKEAILEYREAKQ